MLVPRDQNEAQNGDGKLANRSLEKCIIVLQFKKLDTLPEQNFKQEEVKMSFTSGIVRYHSVQNLLFSRLL
jgi:hypothetical protein